MGPREREMSELERISQETKATAREVRAAARELVEALGPYSHIGKTVERLMKIVCDGGDVRLNGNLVDIANKTNDRLTTLENARKTQKDQVWEVLKMILAAIIASAFTYITTHGK
jgi:hypothetical protein